MKMDDKQKITLRISTVEEECLIIDRSEFEALYEAIKELLLSFYDTVEFVEPKHHNHLLSFLGHKGSWKAVNVFKTTEWLEYLRNSEIRSKFSLRLDLIQYQYNHALNLK